MNSLEPGPHVPGVLGGGPRAVPARAPRPPDQPVVLARRHDGADVSLRADERGEQLAVAGGLEVLTLQPRRELLVHLRSRASRRSIFARPSPARRRASPPSPARPACWPSGARARRLSLGHVRELGQQMGVLAWRTGRSAPRAPGAPRRPLPLASTVERSWRPTVRRIMYSTSGFWSRRRARGERRCRVADEVRRVQALGSIRTTEGPGRSRGTRTRAGARAPASSESNASTIRCANREASRSGPRRARCRTSYRAGHAGRVPSR